MLDLLSAQLNYHLRKLGQLGELDPENVFLKAYLDWSEKIVGPSGQIFRYAKLWSGSFCGDMVSRKDLVGCFDSCCSFYESYLSNLASYGVRDGLRKPKIQLAFKEHLWLPYLESRELVDRDLVDYARRTVDSLNCSALHHTVVIDPDNELLHCRKVASAKIDKLILDNLEGNSFRRYIDARYTCRSCINENICFGCPAVDEVVEKRDSGNPCPFYFKVSYSA